MAAAHVVRPMSTTIATPSSNDDNANPFDSSHAYSSDDSTTSLPARPQQAVLSVPSAQRHMAKDQRRHDSVADRDSDILGTEQEVFDEKRWSHRKQQSSIDRSPRHTYDPEKGHSSPRTSQPKLYTNEVRSIQRSNESLAALDTQQAQKAWKILLHLSGPCVALSFLTLIWALFSILVTLLYQPLRLCTPRLSMPQQIRHFLAPTLNLHLRCIHAPVFSRPTEDDGVYSASWLLIVHLVAPAVALCNMVAAWIVAMYWGLARIVGDPSGIDKKDDGAEAVLGLTRFWQGLLMKGVKLQQ